jgi:hypothetical protein
MKLFNREQIIGALLLLSSFSYVEAQEVLMKSSNGESYIIDITPEESFLSVIEHFTTLSEQPEFCIDFSLSSVKIMPTSATTVPRNYNSYVTLTEKTDIAYIINTLSKSKLITLMHLKKNLELAGDRINHVHPLRFLMTIFLDEELKVGLRNIRTNGWVWNDFMKGLRDSFNEEFARMNMREEYVRDFTSTLRVRMEDILPLIHNAKWDQLVDVLINILPREGRSDRYDL